MSCSNMVPAAPLQAQIESSNRKARSEIRLALLPTSWRVMSYQRKRTFSWAARPMISRPPSLRQHSCLLQHRSSAQSTSPRLSLSKAASLRQHARGVSAGAEVRVRANWDFCTSKVNGSYAASHKPSWLCAHSLVLHICY